MDQTFISDLLIRGILGISDHERSQPQDILLNIVMYGDISKAGQSDAIDDCINYRTVSKKLVAFVERSRRYTVEALATDIARICLEENGVSGVRVRVEKPGAARFSRSVGVEIERFPEKSNPPGRQAYISLGSNIEPAKNIQAAARMLRETCDLYALSSVWETAAVGQSGPRFLNATAWISTLLNPDELKQTVLSRIETSLGRVRSEDKFAPRTIDLDLIVYDEKILEPALWRQNYLAVPTAELRPDLSDPATGRSLRQVAKELKAAGEITRRSDVSFPFQNQPVNLEY